MKKNTNPREIAVIEMHRTNLLISFYNGVFIVFILLSEEFYLPNTVFYPVAVIMPRPVPWVILHPQNTMFLTLNSSKLFGSTQSDLFYGSASPVKLLRSIYN